MKRKLLVITERRADYSKFKPVLKEIKKSSKLDYHLVVTGSHLLKEHGFTINEIRNDGFKISSKFNMYSRRRPDSGSEMARATGKTIIYLSKLIEKIKPDIILSGFDIGANLAAALVGAHMNMVVAHIEGGEVTGTIDESIRHATSKFAHIHLTTNSKATKRLIKMGEDSRFIFTVGNPSLDSIKENKPISEKILEKEFGLNFRKPFVVILQHTVTTELDKIDKYFFETVRAVNELGIQAIIIYGNADAGSKKLLQIIKKSNIKQYNSIPFSKYINLLKHASALVGNSSSGIMEAPFLHIPSINIGTRQKGRLAAKSVINVGYKKSEIIKAITKSINDKKFLNKIKKQKNLYGNGKASKKIVNILEQIDLKKVPIQKRLTY